MTNVLKIHGDFLCSTDSNNDTWQKIVPNDRNNATFFKSLPNVLGGTSWYVCVVGTVGEATPPDNEADPVACMYG